ncbi:MAG: cell division protein ZapA [Fibrobacterota bacterium]|nr:cell division protein ZapA [Fibrobacterota bacterium]QQS06905.1 MAG: cell division protein ZapA [Fibrobacterota bacterium]
MDAREPKLDHSRRVSICGETFGIRSDAPPETIERVARLVDDRFQRARAQMGETDRFRAAVLAGLLVAGENVETLEELESVRAELQALKDRLQGLVQRLSED